MITSYLEAKNYLEQFIPTPQTTHNDMQLERIEKLCNLLENPQTQYPIVHVGGTSGKGSTATFTAEILKEAGLKVGLHTSPHLELITERMQINNRPITQAEFIKLVNEFTSILGRIEALYKLIPSYFEILVAMSLIYFARQKVDAAVIEVGLGGMLDATNIIPPSLAILTNISLDHTNILGKTVYSILKDKMGIIKKGAPAVVSSVTQPKLQKILIGNCRKLNVPLYLLTKDFPLRKEQLALPGEFQHQNFSLAVKACELFIKKYFPAKIKSLPLAYKKSARSTFIPGRLEIVQKKPLIILDGAHNKAKMTALVTSLKKLYPGQKFITIIAVKQGKPTKTLIRLLQPVTAKFVCTSFTQTTDTGLHTSNHASALALLTSKPTVIINQSPQATHYALKVAKELNLPILVTGSLYLVGEVRGVWIQPASLIS